MGFVRLEFGWFQEEWMGEREDGENRVEEYWRSSGGVVER